jgi:hypothetical protein
MRTGQPTQAPFLLLFSFSLFGSYLFPGPSKAELVSGPAPGHLPPLGRTHTARDYVYGNETTWVEMGLAMVYVEWLHTGFMSMNRRVYRTCGRPPRNKEIGDYHCRLASCTTTCHMGSVLTKYVARTRILHDMKI